MQPGTKEALLHLQQVQWLTSLEEFIQFPCDLLIQSKSDQFLTLCTLFHVVRLILLSILRLLLSRAVIRHRETATVCPTHGEQVKKLDYLKSQWFLKSTQ